MSDDIAIEYHRYVERSALCLRDVLPEVFAHLLANDTDAFLAALSACREWAAVGIPVRWRRVYLSALARVADVSRRQMYADYVQELVVWSYSPVTARVPEAAIDDVLKGISWPRLRKFSGPLTGGMLGAEGIAPFLQPRLEELWCGAAYLSKPAVRQQLVAQCQRLRKLRQIDVRCRRVPDESSLARSLTRSAARTTDATSSIGDDCCWLSELLQELPRLGALKINQSFGACDPDAFVRLASLAHLEQLDDVCLDRAALRHVRDRVAQPFPALRNLCAHVASDALALLAEVNPLLEKLELTFRGPVRGGGDGGGGGGGGGSAFSYYPSSQEAASLPLPALNELTRLSRMHRLCLNYPRGMTPTRRDLAALLDLPPQLQVLELNANYSLLVRDFSDHDFAALVGRLARLEILVFNVRTAPGRMTAAAFRTVGTACRGLRVLQLRCKPFLWALDGAREKPLFPQLQYLISNRSYGLVRAYWDLTDWQRDFDTHYSPDDELALQQEPGYRLSAQEESPDLTQPPWMPNSGKRLPRWLKYKLRKLHAPQLQVLQIHEMKHRTVIV